jgi:hypothetical protein
MRDPIILGLFLVWLGGVLTGCAMTTFFYELPPRGLK